MNQFDIQVDRNTKGTEFEKTGHIERALELYEINKSENFQGNHPYDRLAIIYSKQGRVEDEIRVLNKAILVFEKLICRNREDLIPKLEKFKKRLVAANKKNST